MGKPNSSLSTAISIRLPNDLLEAVARHALSQGLINESGRSDKRGQPNLSAAVSHLLKQALESLERPSNLIPQQLSDSVSISPASPFEIDFTIIEHRLTERVRDVIAEQLNQFLTHYPLGGTRAIAEDIASATDRVNDREGEFHCDPNLNSDSQDTKEDTRERILHAASRGFRSHGYNGIGVNAVAKDAGVTSGAFYGYFRSKEDAFLAAVVDGLQEYRQGIEAFRANQGTNWPVALADYYVGRQHREDLACGCALPTLSPEVIRSDQRIRSAYQIELLKLNEAIALGLSTGTTTEKRDTAWVILAVLAGGVTLARAVWDEAVAEEIAQAIHRATVEIARST